MHFIVLSHVSIYSGAESQTTNIDHVYSARSRQAANTSCSETTRPEEDAFPVSRKLDFIKFDVRGERWNIFKTFLTHKAPPYNEDPIVLCFPD